MFWLVTYPEIRGYESFTTPQKESGKRKEKSKILMYYVRYMQGLNY